MPHVSRRSFLSASAAIAAGSAFPSSAHAAIPGAPLAGTKTKFAANLEMWWGGAPLVEKMKKAKALGFTGVEFWPWRGRPIDEMAKASQELGLEIAQFTGWGFSPGMNEPKNHDHFEKEVRESCAVAKKLKCRKVLVVAGNDVAGMTQDEMHGHVITALKRVKPIAEGEGIMLILEPMNIRVDHKGHCLYGSEKALRICKEVGSPMIKICWDLYHMQLSEGDLCGRLRDGVEHLGYVQLADTPGRCEPGTGEVHYNRVLKQLFDLGYKDYVGVECNPSLGEEKAAEMIAAADVW